MVPPGPWRARVNCPGASSSSQPRSTRRFSFPRVPSIFPVVVGRPVRGTTCLACNGPGASGMISTMSRYTSGNTATTRPSRHGGTIITPTPWGVADSFASGTLPVASCGSVSAADNSASTCATVSRVISSRERSSRASSSRMANSAVSAWSSSTRRRAAASRA